MTPYLEVRNLPGRSRTWLVVLCGALLVMPIGALLPGGTTDPALRALAIVAILALSPVLGLGFSRPRQFVTVDGDEGTIVLRTTGGLPDPRAHESRWPISAATRVVLENHGTTPLPLWGVRIELDGAPAIELRRYEDRDLAQDTVDHLVLLGLPGPSRAAGRANDFTGDPSTVWL